MSKEKKASARPKERTYITCFLCGSTRDAFVSTWESRAGMTGYFFRCHECKMTLHMAPRAPILHVIRALSALHDDETAGPALRRLIAAKVEEMTSVRADLNREPASDVQGTQEQ